jgi:mutator protein MutT
MIKDRRGVVVMVFNDKGELALQLRSKKNDSFPSYWDFSAGGKIEPGEDNESAAKRELKEELGIKTNLEFVTNMHCKYPEWNSSFIWDVNVPIYKTHSSGPFKIDSKEIEEAKFFTLDGVGKMIGKGVRFHPEFIIAWNSGIIFQAATS